MCQFFLIYDCMFQPMFMISLFSIELVVACCCAGDCLQNNIARCKSNALPGFLIGVYKGCIVSDLLIVLYTYFAITARTAHIEDGHGYH
jgi:hypothetical protein